MIPKTIHYCWFGGNEPPESLKKYIKTWKKYCPDYEIRRWNERNYDINSCPFVRDAYQAKAYAFVSDYARLDIIYNHGGVYLDTDVELLKNLDFLLENMFYIGIQQNGYLCTTGLGFGAEKGNPIVYAMLKEYDALAFDLQKLDALACPKINHRIIERYGKIDAKKISYLDDATVYPSQYFDPIAPGNTENLMCQDTVSIHHYAATWTSDVSRFKRKLIILFGENK